MNGTSAFRHHADDVALRQNASEAPADPKDHQRSDTMLGEQLGRGGKIGGKIDAHDLAALCGKNGLQAHALLRQRPLRTNFMVACTVCLSRQKSCCLIIGRCEVCLTHSARFERCPLYPQKRILIGLTFRAWPVLTEGHLAATGHSARPDVGGESCSRAWQEPFCYSVLQRPRHFRRRRARPALPMWSILPT